MISLVKSARVFSKIVPQDYQGATLAAILISVYCHIEKQKINDTLIKIFIICNRGRCVSYFLVVKCVD